MRIKMTLAAAMGVSMLMTAPAHAGQDQESEKTEKSEKASADKDPKAEDKQICRRIALEMGSRRKQKVCLTKEGWEEYRKEKRGGN